MRTIILILMGALAASSSQGCAHFISSATPLPLPRSPQAQVSFNLLVSVIGKVDLKRDGWSAFYPTAFGTELHHGDQLFLSEDSNAIVLCDGLSLWFVPAGTSSLSNGCPPSKEHILVRSEGNLAPTRGSSEDNLIPYIISPRATSLITSTPTLRWNPVLGATSYTVSIVGENFNWQTTIDSTKIVFPGQPPLQPNTPYSLIVTANDGKSSNDENIGGLGFSLLSSEEAQPIQEVADQVMALPLPDESRTFVIAQLFAQHDLFAEAIDMLEKAITQGDYEENIYIELGDLYLQIGLPLQAEPEYSRAVTLANAFGDLEGSASAEAGLGKVYLARGQRNDAIQYLEKARLVYQSIGDLQQGNQIEDLLTSLSP